MTTVPGEGGTEILQISKVSVAPEMYPLLACLFPTHTKRLRVKTVDYFPEGTFHFFVPQAVD